MRFRKNKDCPSAVEKRKTVIFIYFFNARTVFNSDLLQIQPALQFLKGRKCLTVQELEHTKSPWYSHGKNANVLIMG